MTAKSHPQCEVCNNRHRYRMEVFQRWRAAGLCPGCGKVRDRYLRCADCRKKEAAQRRRRRLQRKLAAA